MRYVSIGKTYRAAVRYFGGDGFARCLALYVAWKRFWELTEASRTHQKLTRANHNVGRMPDGDFDYIYRNTVGVEAVYTCRAANSNVAVATVVRYRDREETFEGVVLNIYDRLSVTGRVKFAYRNVDFLFA